MYYIPTQDVMGTLSDVFTNYKYDDHGGQDTLQRLTSTFSAQLEQNDFRSKLDKYLERAKLKKKDENNVSISTQAAEKCIQSQSTCSRKGSSSRIMIITHDSQTNEQDLQNQNRKPCTIESETQCQIEQQDQECQFEGVVFTENYESSKFQNVSSIIKQYDSKNDKSYAYQGDSYQSQQSSELLENIHAMSDKVEQDCQKCGRPFKKVTDAECQYDKLMNAFNKSTSFSDFPLLIRTRSRCMSQTNQFSQQKLSEPEEFTLEEELQLRDQLLDQKFSEIQDLQQQLEDLHRLLNEKQRDNDNTDSSSESSIVEALNRQIKVHTEIQENLTDQLVRQSQDVAAIKEELDELIAKKQELLNEREQMIGVIGQLKDQINEIEDSKSKEINIINQDYRDKMSKQSMIIDELQQQISMASSPVYQTSLPYISQIQRQTIGSDSQLSRGSMRTKEEKDSMLKSLKKMTTITAGLMSTKYDYTTLGALGQMDQKSQQKLESFKKQYDDN